jgi:ribonuclease R
MSENLEERILEHVQSDQYRPIKPSGLARALNLSQETDFDGFRDALKQLQSDGKLVRGANGSLMMAPKKTETKDVFSGTYRHNKRGFGFVVPIDPTNSDDLFIPEGDNAGALTGDVVKAKIVNREQRDGKSFNRGRVLEIVERGQKRFVGSLAKTAGEWFVHPDGNTLTEPILSGPRGARTRCHHRSARPAWRERCRSPQCDRTAQPAR